MPYHYTTTTITAALLATGLIAKTVLDGVTNGMRFRACAIGTRASALKPDNTVILANLNAHQAAGVHEAVGARVLCIPSYSPEPKDREATSIPSDRSWPS